MRDLLIFLTILFLSIWYSCAFCPDHSSLPECEDVEILSSKKQSQSTAVISAEGTYELGLFNTFNSRNTVSPFYKTSRNLVILFLLLLVVFNSFFLHEYFQQSKMEIVGKEKLQIQRELESHLHQTLRQKLVEKDHQLIVASMALDEKNKMLSGLKLKLNHLKTTESNTLKSKITPLANTIDRNLNTQNDWVLFQQHFAQLYPGFLEKLRKRYPYLRSNDLRLCSYLRMNLNTQEIANLLHIHTSSVQKARYRLRKKLNLHSAQALDTFITSI